MTIAKLYLPPPLIVVIVGLLLTWIDLPAPLNARTGPRTMNEVIAIVQKLGLHYRSDKEDGTLLALVSRQYRGACGRKPPRWLAAARDLLHEHFAEPLSLGDVAKAVNVHPVHLAREFRRWYRCTVGDYTRRVRIDYARDALIRTDVPLVEIAYGAGFSDQSHFTRTFRRLTGMTPAEFRATKSPR
jgi:AraC-like DNA-binding protein